MNDQAARSGWLGADNAVRITVGVSKRYCSVEYLGAMSHLVLAHALTPSMLTRRAEYRQGDPRGLCDENGRYFNLHRAATRENPARMRLKLRVNRTRAMELPGMRELFPEGLPPHFDSPALPPRPIRGVPYLRLVVDNSPRIA